MVQLKQIATISTNMQDAHFWIQRKGSETTVGTIHNTFSPEHIGVKVSDLTILNPVYFSYKLTHCHNLGMFKLIAKGTLDLKHITVEDVRNMKF